MLALDTAITSPERKSGARFKLTGMDDEVAAAIPPVGLHILDLFDAFSHCVPNTKAGRFALLDVVKQVARPLPGGKVGPHPSRIGKMKEAGSGDFAGNEVSRPSTRASKTS